jgi:hypothetical protein
MSEDNTPPFEWVLLMVIGILVFILSVLNAVLA